MRKNIIIIATCVWICLVFILCTMPSESVPETGVTIPHFDKFVHAVMFGGVAFLLYTTFKYWNRRRALSYAFAIAILYGGIIEIIQPIFFNRGCELTDWIADSVGALIAILIAPRGLKWINKLFEYLHIKI